MKGLIFSLEIIIAISLFLSFILFLFLVTFERISPYTRYERIHLLAEDGIQVLSEAKVSDMKEDIPIIQELLDRGVLTQDDLDASIIEIIGTFWSMGNFSIAKNITEVALKETMPLGVDYGFYIGDESIFNSSDSEPSQISTSNRLISGYQLGEVIRGFSSRAGLEKIKSKQSSSYAYFGGFVGQGNLKTYIRDIPADAIIKEIYMEFNIGGNFNLYINGELCNNFVKSAAGDFPVDSWIINDPGCLNDIIPGSDNKFDINFTGGGINDKFIGGGFIKVSYDTSEMVLSNVNTMRYYFPGIDGIINLYDSFYVPGTLVPLGDTEINARLHYYNNISVNGGATMILNIGGVEIFRNDDIGEQNVVVSSDDFVNKFGDEDTLIDALSNKNVPIRFGAEEFGAYAGGGAADAVLITDVSGSMVASDVLGDITNYNETSCWSYYCRWNVGKYPYINYPTCDVQRQFCRQKMDMAREVDRDFVKIVLDVSGNRVGTVSYTDDIDSVLDLTNDATSLTNEINSYTPLTGTCICCGVERAAKMLDTVNDPDRFKGMLVMSDGIANRRTVNCGSCPYPWSSAEDCAIYRACEARKKGYTTFSVAFGDEADEETLKKISCWDCDANNWIGDVTLPDGSTANCLDVRYAKSNSYEELKKIYKELGQYFVGVGYTTQKVDISGNIPLGNILHPDSYIELEYDPETPDYKYGEVSIDLETDSFGECNGSFFVPQQLTVDEILRTSYSGDYWTRDLFVKNSVYNWENVYSLTDFGVQYHLLGDPFHAQLPAKYIKSGEQNEISLFLGTGPTEQSDECSANDRAIYSARFNAITPYSPPLPKAKGNCVTVYYDKDHDGTPEGSVNVNVGPDASPPCIDVDDLDMDNAIHYAFLRLLEKLNFVDHGGLPGSQTNPIDIEITEDLLIDVNSISNIPSLWGPLIFRLDVWL